MAAVFDAGGRLGRAGFCFGATIDEGLLLSPLEWRDAGFEGIGGFVTLEVELRLLSASLEKMGIGLGASEDDASSNFENIGREGGPFGRLFPGLEGCLANSENIGNGFGAGALPIGLEEFSTDHGFEDPNGSSPNPLLLLKLFGMDVVDVRVGRSFELVLIDSNFIASAWAFVNVDVGEVTVLWRPVLAVNEGLDGSNAFPRLVIEPVGDLFAILKNGSSGLFN